MVPLPSSHLRLARPSRDLHRAERFWGNGLGLKALYRTGAEAEGGHALMMLGWPEAAWHIELIDDPHGETPPRPTDEDLLVLCVGGPLGPDVIGRLIEAAVGRWPHAIHTGTDGESPSPTQTDIAWY